MAATVSLSFPLDLRNNYFHQHSSFFTSTHLKFRRLPPFIPHAPLYRHPIGTFIRYVPRSFRVFSSSSSSSDSPAAITSTYHQDPFRTSRFLTNQEIERLQFLYNFVFFQELKSGSLVIRVMRPEELDVTVELLAESFAESMLLPLGYVSLLKFLVKQYLIERRTLMPHTATLIGFFREKGEDGIEKKEQLVGTVEVSFNRSGSNASVPTPTPPRDCPYICNMTVKKQLRRRGIGWHLLKASEELISQMSSAREFYLHCRMIDAAPFNMYKKAGYKVVKTDSILILLTLQRRKHLMCKTISVLDNSCTSDNSHIHEERCNDL